MEKVGLFIASYQIGGDKPGAPLFNVNLSIYTPGKTVSGIGHISQATNPPLDVVTHLKGTYTYMCVMPKNCHIQVRLTGSSVVKLSPVSGVEPVALHNVELLMVLTEDWKTGGANYSYLDKAGNLHEVEGAPVKEISPKSISE